MKAKEAMTGRGWLAAACVAALAWTAEGAGTPQLQSEYGSVVQAGGPAGDWADYFASGSELVSYSGSGTSNWTGEAWGGYASEGEGGVRLLLGEFGHPVEMTVDQYSLGDVIPAPAGADTNTPPAGFTPMRVGKNPEAYYQNADGSAIWLPSRHELVAAAGGQMEVSWAGMTGSVVYAVSSIPEGRPARVFWTESPYNAPMVYLSANSQPVFATLHYNNYVGRPMYEVVTNYDATGAATGISTNYVAGVWLDGEGTAQCLRSAEVEGILLLEYYQDGNYAVSLGVQPVQVLRPTIETIKAHVGDRLLPNDRYYGTDNLYPKVMTGLSGGDEDRLMMVDGSQGYAHKDNWLYAIRATEGSEWDAEVYWMHKDDRGVEWPFEVDWFSISWPGSIIKVVTDGTDKSAPTYMPGGMTADIVSQATREEPKKESANASLSQDGTELWFKQPGYALMKYFTPDDFWFEPVEAVWHDDANLFDPTPIDWAIGDEFTPPKGSDLALQFDGTTTFVDGGQDIPIQLSPTLTAEVWTYRTGLRGSDTAVASQWVTNSSIVSSPCGWELGFKSDGTPYFRVEDREVTYAEAAGKASLMAWHHLAGTCDEEKVKLYWNGQLVAEDDAPDSGSHDKARKSVSLGRSQRANTLPKFQGILDEFRLWSVARTEAEIQRGMKQTVRAARTGLVEAYSMDEGKGTHLRDVVDGSYATIHGAAKWAQGSHLLGGGIWEVLHDSLLPGYVYSGTAYDPMLYNYPTEWQETYDSAVIPVNTNEFEIWWGAQGKATGMPSRVFYPSQVAHYQSLWPEDAPQIVIASGLGSGTNAVAGGEVYVQNDKSLPGYNPNEEHAVVVGATAYALRDDLNAPGGASEPFVLVRIRQSGSRPKMAVFAVVRTNAQYQFVYPIEAGNSANGPMPLSLFGGTEQTTCVAGEGWRDRKLSWWAAAAGADGGELAQVMRYYYKMQEGFCFPELSTQPAVGTELPWLPTTHESGGTKGTPIDVTYRVSWPKDTPTMDIAQTLTTATGGLPEIWNQASVQVVYEQSQAKKAGPSVQLFDPVQEQAVDLHVSVVDSMVASGLANKELTSARYRFAGLGGGLSGRVYFDPTRGAAGQLVLEGQLRSPLLGAPYLLPNWLTQEEKQLLLSLGSTLEAADKSKWETAVNALRTDECLPIGPNDPYVNAALSSAWSAETNAYGFVTLAFNNSTNEARVPQGNPVSLSILQVGTNLFGALYLDVVESDNVLAEELSLRYPNDFGGKELEYDFEWRWSDPVAGSEDGRDKSEWNAFFPSMPGSCSNGAMSVTVDANTAFGAAFLLSDHYFAARYRRADGKGPTGTNWSPWVSTYGEGWIHRVMTAINPYEQRFHDMTAYAPNLVRSLIEQCGPPYEGPVALTEESMADSGLIQIYQTVLERALSLTLAGSGSDPNTNDSLLFAATRLCKLYMILGNEAFADAADPTVMVDPNTLDWYERYAPLESSLFCFENQVANLLDEELALLRGRDGQDSPDVKLSPVFNRLVWNFTDGIDGGEVAYACNYNIRGAWTNTTGTYGAADAKRMFPQGHGDAWGHYMSALAPYYRLMAYTNFGWNTIPGATSMEGSTVSVDYYDEEAFAIAAAAKARTGREIVNLAAIKDYRAGAEGLDRFPAAPDTNLMWSAEGWASRAGQAAYVDWVVANSLLLDSVTNLNQVDGYDVSAEGLHVIDRGTVPQIAEIATGLGAIQRKMDETGSGMNPLGLAEDGMVLDVSASELDAGKGVFEQVYDRAVDMLGQAEALFGEARTASSALRAQYDSLDRSMQEAMEEEFALQSELIALYGYPYADDIGVTGTYAQGYDGPDLVNYMVIDLDETLGAAPTRDTSLTNVITTLTATRNDQMKYGVSFNTNRMVDSTVILTNTFNSLGLRVKPEGWTGRRRAQGAIQASLYTFAEAYYDFRTELENYTGLEAELQRKYQIFVQTANVREEDIESSQAIAEKKKYINRVKAALNFFAEGLETACKIMEYVGEATEEALPMTHVGPFIAGASTGAAKSAAGIAESIAYGVMSAAGMVFEYASETDAMLKENDITDMEVNASTNAMLVSIRADAMELLTAMEGQMAAMHTLHAKELAMQNALEDVLAKVAEGERLLELRGQARSRIAQMGQEGLYADMMYRTYRNEALAKYVGMRDMAVRYAYLAAKAFDYETGLLDRNGSSAARSFLEDIVKSRSLGRVTDDGQPVAVREGDSGVAGTLCRLKAVWDSAKGRMGMNNPDSASTRISLRKELMRIPTSSKSDPTWQNALAKYRVKDLNAVDAYRRYCVPYGIGTNAEPGLVIPFSTEIVGGKNFFGWPLGGGDNTFDPTWFATKIRSVGVWFSGYNTTYNTNMASGAGLANTPVAYLVPVGADRMVQGIDRTRSTVRSWNVYEQVLPLAEDWTGSGGGGAGLLGWYDTLSESFGLRRRHSAFRAHHDSGTFADEELCSAGRLAGRSVWNTQWVLIIPGRSLLADGEEGLNRFIYGAKKDDGARDGYGVTDIRLFFNTYSYSGD
ncbi:MAG: hypothetical protein ILO10_05800 [Kiritimatiellae bacterium]|nr:hypothetical protein [Kiritimatiellia bacterium]